MSSIITLKIPGEPNIWKKHHNHESVETFRDSLHTQYEGSVLSGALEIICTYNVSPPKSLQDRVQKEEVPAATGNSPRIQKLNSFVLHALQHILFGSQSQIVKMTAEKKFVAVDPSTEIHIQRLSNPILTNDTEEEPIL